MPIHTQEPKFRWKKWLVIGALIGAGAYWGPGLLHGKGGEGAPGGMMGMMGGPTPVSVATVVTKPVTEWHDFSGMFEAVSSVEVRPRVSGQITAIHFTDGAEVKKGQPLFTIDPRPYEAAMITAKASLVETQATLARAKKLIASKAISRAEYEAAQSAYDRALGNYKSAEVNLEYTRIAAPISGKISRAEITVGNLVNAASPPLLASIVDLSPIYASFEVDESTFIKTVQGVPTAKLKTIPIEVSAGNGGSELLKASVHSFDNQLKAGSGTIRVRAILENSDQTLVPGLYAKVRLGAAEASDVVLINPAAVNTDQDRKFVLVVSAENKAEYRPVKLGTIDGALQVVREGLNPGEQIVVNGLQRVKPGTEVKPEPVDMETLKGAEAEEQAAPAAEEAKPEAEAKH